MLQGVKKSIEDAAAWRVVLMSPTVQPVEPAQWKQNLHPQQHANLDIFGGGFAAFFG